MITIAQTLWVIGSLIILMLGLLHLLYTLFTHKLHPRTAALQQQMQITNPILTKQTTMWKAWIGFNCSHSSGAMFFGIINLYLSITMFEFLMNSTFILILNLIMMVFYCWLGYKYWFKIPFTGGYNYSMLYH